MAEKETLTQKWINTPFAFTRFSKNLSLLQQEILLKVSDRLQPFIEEFFGNEKLYQNHKKPKALFSDAVKNSGIAIFDISYAELGVSVNNFFAAKDAARKVLDLKVSAPGVDENGKQIIRDYNVFSFSEMSAGNDRVVFSLNTDMVDYVFDMTEKYVSHPDNIAYIGTVDRMPMIYYLLRKSCENKWQPVIKLTVMQIKEYLGMMEYADGKLVKEAYPKFSQFRKKVLDTSIADINRLKKEGLLDVCVNYEPYYKGVRKVGNPFFIKFYIYKSIKEMQKANMPQQQNMMFDDKPGVKEWQAFLKAYKGVLSEYLKAFSVCSYDGEQLVLYATQEQAKYIEQHLIEDEITVFRQSMKKAFGKVVNFGYKIIK